jgi:hypothetical protein
MHRTIVFKNSAGLALRDFQPMEGKLNLGVAPQIRTAELPKPMTVFFASLLDLCRRCPAFCDRSIVKIKPNK